MIREKQEVGGEILYRGRERLGIDRKKKREKVTETSNGAPSILIDLLSYNELRDW